MKKSDWPRVNDVVVTKIKRVLNYGAFVELSEYPGKEGFVHISNIASSWVKNIRSFVSEGNVRVGAVIHTDPDKGMIDVSLRKVTQQQEKRKLEEWRREKRADKLFDMICKELKEDFAKSYQTVAQPLIEEYGDLYAAFENAAAYGAGSLKGIPEKWANAIAKLAAETIKEQAVSVKGDFTLVSEEPDGLLRIKDALSHAKGEGVKVSYISAPKYRVEVTAEDYEKAEKTLTRITDEVLAAFKKAGVGSFERIKA